MLFPGCLLKKKKSNKFFSWTSLCSKLVSFIKTSNTFQSGPTCLHAQHCHPQQKRRHESNGTPLQDHTRVHTHACTRAHTRALVHKPGQLSEWQASFDPTTDKRESHVRINKDRSTVLEWVRPQFQSWRRHYSRGSEAHYPPSLRPQFLNLGNGGANTACLFLRTGGCKALPRTARHKRELLLLGGPPPNPKRTHQNSFPGNTKEEL